ncbi:MAG: peptidoglycan DD-metalloendopeptidase family protein [Candidatus Colwellbacteria bacterium]
MRKKRLKTAIFLGVAILTVPAFFILLRAENEITLEPISQVIEKYTAGGTGFCSEDVEFSSEEDERFCAQEPKITEAKGVEVDLTLNKALLYDGGKLVKVLPLYYQAPEDKWFQTPTGYFQVGVKKEKHLSSLFPVTMPYAIQLYEDFFIHGIPYRADGTPVNSTFTGGCLRFKDGVAKEIYDFVKTGDQMVVYKSLGEVEIKAGFQAPVDWDKAWIRQRFLAPYRQFHRFGGDRDNLALDYYQRAGMDLAPLSRNQELRAYAILEGQVAKIQLNNGQDHGLGNTVIIEHQIGGEKVYSLYAHLASIRADLKGGDSIHQGEVIGVAGNSGYGCNNFWRVGKDGCDSPSPADVYLHLEIKTKPVLENPEGGEACESPDGGSRPCYGYAPDYPQKYGYINPLEFITEKRE